MSHLWTDKQLWMRIALIASGVWLGGVIIVSQIGSSNFRWFPFADRDNYDMGPAGITAFLGISVIYFVCLSIPWIAAKMKQDSD